MNQLELSALLWVALIPNHGNKRRDNQGERSSKLVAHIGKEVELQLVHLTGLLDAVFPDLDFILHSLLLYHAAAIVPEDSHNEEQIKNDGPGREIERRMDVNLQPAHLFAHGSVSIHHLHFEHIIAREEIGKCNFRSSVRSHHPLIVQSLHAIKEAATCRKRHLVRSQLDGKRLVLITQVKFRIAVER